MTAIIIEDDHNYSEMLQSLLSSHFPEIELKGIARSVEQALNLLQKDPPNLVFSDIEIINGTAFDVLKDVNHNTFQIIFITGHNDFAIQAFKFSAVDYLLKPVLENEFCNAVEKAIERIKHNEMQHIRLMLENIDRNNDNKRLVLRTLEQIHIITIREIIRCQSDNTYTTFYLENNENILVSKGLKEYEDLLCNNGFFKIHQSHIINLQFLRKIDKTSDEVILSDKTRLPLSLRRKQSLLQILGNS